MSNRLTFSLASLVLIIALIAMPVMAQEQGVFTIAAGTDVTPKSFRVIATGTTTGITGALELVIPDLEKLFRQGVTITLLAPTTQQLDADPVTDTTDAVRKIAAKDVVFSEIMWALNTGGAFDTYQADQWIELYATVPADVYDNDPGTDGNQNPDDIVAIDNWLIHYATGRDSLFALMNAGGKVVLSSPSGALATGDPAGTSLTLAADDAADADKTEYIIVDQVTNLRRDGLGNPPGQNGKTATDLDNPVDLISMFRKINYEADRGVAPDGFKADAWGESTEYYEANRLGTPGARNFQSREEIPPTPVLREKVIISEVGNLTGTEHDWIELRNVSDGAVNIKNWHIGSISAMGDDTILVKFPNDDHYTIPAKGIILVVATDPYNDSDHPILTGTKWNKGQNRAIKVAATSTYYVASGDDDTLDNDGLGDGNYLLVLRSGYDKAKPSEKIEDITGATKISDTDFDTDN